MNQLVEQNLPGLVQQGARPFGGFGERRILGAGVEPQQVEVGSGSFFGTLLPEGTLVGPERETLGVGRVHQGRPHEVPAVFETSNILRVTGVYLHEAQRLRRSSSGPSLVEVYEDRLRVLQERVRDLEAENVAAVAESNRSLVAAMVDQDWLGSRILATLSGPMTLSVLASAVASSVDDVAVSLASLHKGGAVTADGQRFVRTEQGTEILRRLQALATSLSPVGA